MKKLKATLVYIIITFMLPFNVFASYISEIGTTISSEVAGIYLDGIYMGHEGKGAFIDNNGIAMIPARYIDLYVNGNYEESKIIWDDVKKEFYATKEMGETITAVAGENSVIVNGKRIEQCTPNIILDDRLYIPLKSALKYSKNRKISYVNDSVITNMSKARDRFYIKECGEITDQQIENYIKKNINKNFKVNEFSKRIIDTGIYSDANRFIVYKYKIGDFETNSGYFVAVYNDETEITIIGSELYDLDESCLVSENINESELKQKALKKNNINWEIINQSITKHYIPDIGKDVYDVITTYKKGEIITEKLNRFVIE